MNTLHISISKRYLFYLFILQFIPPLNPFIPFHPTIFPLSNLTILLLFYLYIPSLFCRTKILVGLSNKWMFSSRGKDFSSFFIPIHKQLEQVLTPSPPLPPFPHTHTHTHKHKHMRTYKNITPDLTGQRSSHGEDKDEKECLQGYFTQFP